MSKLVFRCFKVIERCGDRLTGAAGPFFVTFAVVLISVGAVCFFDVIAPELHWPLLSVPICGLFCANLVMHYYYVCTVPPGFVDDPPRIAGDDWRWAKPSSEHARSGGVQWSLLDNVTKASITRCKKCRALRPERAHHCRVCNRCVLKYDHHCPVRINQCVGLHNERHFVLFMLWMIVCCFCYCTLGWTKVWQSLGYGFTELDEWPYHVPQVAFLLIYILAGVIGLALVFMGGYHLWSAAVGETSVESQDHDVYRRMAKRRGDSFVNSYDLGAKKNLLLFFNIGPQGYPWYTLLLPLRIMPYTDGRAWARRNGLTGHRGVQEGEELTDEEDELPA